jgi:DNA-binding HxlR family transcriptional regulator
MRRTSFADMRCSIARTLDVIGEWWTLLILREAFMGSRHFAEFERELGIAPNVLTQRLSRLVEHGVLAVESTSQNGKALAYRLTDKGLALYPVIVALAQWGDAHAAAPDGPPVKLVERATGQEIGPMAVRAQDGRTLRPQDVAVAAGLGAQADDLARLEVIRERRARRSPDVTASQKA